jgi:hypothetical protein
MTMSEPTQDGTTYETALDHFAKKGFLTEDVTQSDLTKMPPHQLEGRAAFYEREALFERNARIRRENQAEAERTRIEINRRKMYLRAEAERVFEL